MPREFTAFPDGEGTHSHVTKMDILWKNTSLIIKK